MPRQHYKSLQSTVNDQLGMPHWAACVRHTGQTQSPSHHHRTSWHIMATLSSCCFSMFSHVTGDPFMQSFVLVISTAPCYIVALPTERRQKTMKLFEKIAPPSTAMCWMLAMFFQSGFNHWNWCSWEEVSQSGLYASRRALSGRRR